MAVERIDQRILKALVALGCGCLLFLACADFDIWPLAWVAWVPVLWICLDARTERAWWYGFVCGIAGNAGGFYWFVPYLQRFAHLPLAAALPIFLLLVAYQALTWAVFCHLLRRLRAHAGLPVTFLAPIVYVAVELVVPYVFVWYLAITQAWVRPVIQIAELTGPLGVSFLLILSNAALYEVLHAWHTRATFPRRVLAAGALLAACLGFGLVRIHQVTAARAAAPKLTIGIVQANIGIQEKRSPGLGAEQLAVHQRLSAALAAQGAELIVWPESSYPYTFARDRWRDWPEGDIRRVRRGFDQPLLFGTLTAGNASRYPYNSALLLDRDGALRGRFDKNVLIVFGEYIPYFEQLRFLQTWVPAAAHFARGTDVAVLRLDTTAGPVGLGPMICYEDILPSFGRRLAGKVPNLLVNLTNDAWFGRTSEPYQHLALAVFRTVELRLDLVRAVNTGVSAFIDSTGRVYAQSPSVDPEETPDAEPMVLLADAAIQQPQTLYATLGEWFGGACLLVTFLIFLRVREREGAPVRWRLVATGAAVLLGALVLVVAITGPSHVALALTLLARRVPDGSVPPELEFGAAWRLLLGMLTGCGALGWVLTRRAGDAAPVERVLAVVAIWVVPAIAVGTLEGQQAGLVIGALVGVLLARLGSAVGRGRLVR